MTLLLVARVCKFLENAGIRGCRKPDCGLKVASEALEAGQTKYSVKAVAVQRFGRMKRMHPETRRIYAPQASTVDVISISALLLSLSSLSIFTEKPDKDASIKLIVFPIDKPAAPSLADRHAQIVRSTGSYRKKLRKTLDRLCLDAGLSLLPPLWCLHPLKHGLTASNGHQPYDFVLNVGNESIYTVL